MWSVASEILLSRASRLVGQVAARNARVLELVQKQLPDLRRNPNIMAREHPESVKRLSVERGDLERAATLHALTLHARRTKPRGPHLFLHEP